MSEKTGPVKEVKALYVGDIKIGSITIKCAVLSNEKRVFFQREVVGALTGNKKGGLERYLNAKNLEEYVPEKFRGEKRDQGIIRFISQTRHLTKRAADVWDSAAFTGLILAPAVY